MMKALLFSVFCLSCFSAVFSQSLKDTVTLKEVFVTGRQITERAFYFRNIDSLVLKKEVHTDLSELLLKNSPIYVKTYGAGGLATASFRGTSASHTQVLWNGLNINSPLWGQTDLSQLPVFFTDEVSLYYGSSSLAKTSGGIGGCITLNNTPEWNRGPSYSFAQTAGSFGYIVSQLRAGFSSGKFMSNTRLLLDKSRNNFRYFDDAGGTFDFQRQKNADYTKKGFLQELYYKLNDRQFAGIKIMGTTDNQNLPPIMSFNGAGRYENQKDNHLYVTGEWKYYGSRSAWALNTGVIAGRLGYILSNTNPGGTFVNYDTENISHTVSNKLSFQYNFSGNTVLKSSAEGEFTRARYSDRKENSGFNIGRNDLSVQSSLHHSFTRLVTAYVLARQKVINGDLMPLIAGAGLEYNLSDTREWTFRSNIGKNLRVPDLNDLYFNPGGNRDLKPETGYQADAGFQLNRRWHNIRYQVEVTGFASRISNWILWHPSQYRYWVADNVQRVFSRGAEINAGMNGDAGIFTYQLKGNYSYTRSTNEVKDSYSAGMQLIYIPKHVGNLSLNLKKETWGAVISGHYTGRRYTSTVEDNMHQMPAYYLLDLGLDKKFPLNRYSVDLNFRLNNILNRQYQVIEQRAMPGRNFLVSVVFNFN